ncbi:MAG TPA: NUDIX domain-containing protein [Anaerolineaceae bacterium]
MQATGSSAQPKAESVLAVYHLLRHHMKELLRVNSRIPWMPSNSEGRLYHTDELPAPESCGTAFAFAFTGERMLLTHLVKRGWDIPGGHIEPGESPVEAAVRETLEETRVVVEPVELIGIQELEVFPPLPRDGWTGRLSAQIFYLCRIVEMLPFVKTEEATGRDLFTPDAVRAVPTMVNHDLLYEIALKHARRLYRLA